MSAPLLDAYDDVADLVADLWAHPEVGYQETYTSARIRDFLARHVPGVEVASFARTGLRLRLGPGHNRAVALVAELDALLVAAHPDADPVTGAVHACGHHTQVGIACAVVAELARRPWDLPFDLVVVFVPAEEHSDLETRRGLRDAGEIVWFAGKPEGMRLGAFDDADVAVLTHAMGGLVRADDDQRGPGHREGLRRRTGDRRGVHVGAVREARRDGARGRTRAGRRGRGRDRGRLPAVPPASAPLAAVP
ncbi:MAG: zinc-binding metallopeptidase family protein [Propionibacteriaceae bacterium]